MPSPWFPDWLATRADENPNRSAVEFGGATCTFAQLDAYASSVARKLASVGVIRGDRVATLLGNGMLSAVFPHAVLRLGATLVPLNTRLSEAEIEWQLRDAAPRILIRDDDLDAIAEADVALRFKHAPSSTLAVIYTSGTTGTPKGAMLTLGNFWWSAQGSALNIEHRETDRWVACLPLFHVGGLSILMRAAIHGFTVLVHQGFDAERVNAEIDNGATIVSVVAVMLERMLDARGDRPYPKTLRCVLLGGGPSSMSLLERCAHLGVPVVQTYGLTEACSQVATLSPQNALSRPGSSGKPLYPNQIMLDAPHNDEGEILVRGPIVMKGYLNNPAATSETIVDGWLKTGDMGRIDRDGFLYVLDRRDDLIVSGGENIYPAEVESVLLAHDAIAEAAVIGLPDETWGQRVVAVVRAANHVDARDLEAFCRAALAGYKVPREYRFADRPLPRTASGKIKRGELRNFSAG